MTVFQSVFVASAGSGDNGDDDSNGNNPERDHTYAAPEAGGQQMFEQDDNDDDDGEYISCEEDDMSIQTRKSNCCSFCFLWIFVPEWFEIILLWLAMSIQGFGLI